MIALWVMCVAARLAVGATSTQVAKFQSIAAANDGIVPLTSALYDEITAGPRDYSLSIVLTAMAAQFKCSPCHVFAPEHALVAKQWSKSSQRNDHFFAVLDFPDGQAVYQKLGLQSAPTFQLWRPTEGPRALATPSPLGFESVDFSKTGFTAEGVAAYLEKTAGVPLKFKRPVNVVKLARTVAILVGFVTLIIATWSTVKLVLFSKYLWATLSVLIIITMSSGFMWNEIRHPKYSEVHGDWRISYFTGGYNDQMGAETHIIMVVYAILGFATYTLAYIIPAIPDPSKQRLGIYVWSGISFMMLGVLMSLFSIKQRMYPFSFFRLT